MALKRDQVKRGAWVIREGSDRAFFVENVHDVVVDVINIENRYETIHMDDLLDPDQNWGLL